MNAPPGHTVTAPSSFNVTSSDAGKQKTITISDKGEYAKVPDAAVQKLNSNGWPISGVVFKVCLYDGKYSTPAACPAYKLKRTWYLKSNNNGKVIFDEKLVPSEYAHMSNPFYQDENFNIAIPINSTLTMQEVKAPANCIIDDTVMLWDTSGKTIPMKTHYNDIKPSKIQIHKKDNNGYSLNGVTFELKFVKAKNNLVAGYRPPNSYVPLLREGESIQRTTDYYGDIVWDNLDEGEYLITEVKTTAGNTLLAEPIKVSLPMIMTPAEVQQHNVDTSKGTFDKGYSNNWFFNTVTYDITNNAKLDMPMTGAKGFWKYGFIGMGTMAVGVFVYDSQIEKPKRYKKVRASFSRGSFLCLNLD